MRFSNDNQSWSSPEALASLKEDWDLTAYGGEAGDGIKCVYAKFQDNDGDWNEPISACLILDTVSPTSSASPGGGDYSSPPLVSLSANETATIYYTTDGSTPTTDSLVYSSPLEINSAVSLRFFAVDLAGNAESVNTEEYVVDSDQDGLPNGWEITYGLDPNDATGENGAAGDPDADGLSNLEEYASYHTHPKKADTDGDGMNDGWEVDYGLDPLVDDGAGDADGDGYSNYYEYTQGWDPQQAPDTIYVDVNNSGDEDGGWSSPFNTIQEALAVAVGGDTIQVRAGTYQEEGNITLKEGVTLQGAGAQKCRLDLGGLYYLQLEDSSLLRGFTITNPAEGKSIIYAEYILSATITNNIIRGAGNEQAAIFLDSASARIENNTITDSYIGIRSKGSGAAISNNLIVGNEVGVVATDTNNLEVSYNGFWNNIDYSGLALEEGNIFSDPEFVDADKSNYHLKADSPARDAGNPDSYYNDLDSSRNDLGADGGPKGVSDSTVPYVEISATPSDGYSPLTVSFSATASDEWGIAGYSWDFDNFDGLQQDSDQSAPSHTYTSPGSYLVTLTVTDHSGLSSSATTLITADNPPTITLSTNILAGSAPLTVNYNAMVSGSSSHTFNWDFDWQDGLQTDATSQNPEHTYQDPRAYKITLIVETNSGFQVPATIPITVVGSNCQLQASKQIGNQGGVLKINQNNSQLKGTQVNIPASTLTEETVITISEVSDYEPLPQGLVTVSPTVDFGPDGAKFSNQVELTIPYSAAEIQALGIDSPTHIKAYFYNEDTFSWEAVTIIQIDEENQLITIQANHFTSFSLGVSGDPPATPQNLAATPVSGTRINLGWSDEANNENGYQVERKTAGSSYSLIATLAADSTTYQDTGLEPETTYYYRVRAYNDFGDSAYSSEAQATTQTGGGEDEDEEGGGNGGSSSNSSGGGGGGGGGGGCFIATAAYGTPLAKQVKILCTFRDLYLLTNPLGSKFVALYYKYSPPIAQYIAQKEFLKKLVRIALWPLVSLVSFLLKSTCLGKIIIMGGILILVLLGQRLVKKQRAQIGNTC